MEDGAEDPLGGSEEGDRAVEEPVEDPGSFRRQEMQPGNTGLSHIYGRGEDSASRGREGRHGERGVGMGAPGEKGAGSRTRGGGVGC